MSIRSLPAALAALSLALLPACGDAPAPRDRVGLAQPPAAGAVLQAYVVPDLDTRNDGTLFTRSIGGPAQLAGRFVEAAGSYGIDGAGKARMVVTAFSVSGRAAVFGVSPGLGTPAPLDAFEAGELPVVLTAADTEYVRVGDEIVARSTGGVVTGRWSLPALDAAPATVDGKPIKIKLTDPRGRLAALVRGPDGDVFALTDNVVSAAITRLGGRTERLADFGGVLAAGVAGDGSLRVVAWDRSRTGSTLQLLRIDPATLAVTSRSDTGIDPGAGDVNGIDLVSTATRTAVYVAQRSGAATTSAFLLDDGSTLVRRALPDGTGLFVGRGAGDTVYVYGGPAVNRVSSYDLAAGSLRTDVPELRAPAGAYVVGTVGT